MAVTEMNYMELMKNCSKFNERITGERKTRYPFFDQQTGTAHRPSVYAWRKSEQRYSSKDPDYVYQYPAVKWRRDPAAPPSDATEMKYILHSNKDLNDAINNVQSYGAGGMSMQPPMGSLDAMALMSSGESTLDSSLSQSLQATPHHPVSERRAAMNLKREAAAYDDFDEDPDDLSDDGSDDDDFGAKKKKGKGGAASAKKKKASGGGGAASGVSQSGGYGAPSAPPPQSAAKTPATANDEKRHACNKCGARYKSRPGLSYHKAHVHGDGVQATGNVLAGGDGSNSGSGSGSSGVKGRRGAPPPIEMPSMLMMSSGASSPMVLPPPVIFSPSVDISDTCDFCDGTRLENKKTKQPEELVTCHDCGRSGHPSCLSFTENMRLSTSKFGWQCIECKSCAICGTSDNDDKLLFCDDCDRGFHLYCLQPPLESLPDEQWSCHLCMKVFGPNAAAVKGKKA